MAYTSLFLLSLNPLSLCGTNLLALKHLIGNESFLEARAKCTYLVDRTRILLDDLQLFALELHLLHDSRLICERHFQAS